MSLTCVPHREKQGKGKHNKAEKSITGKLFYHLQPSHQIQIRLLILEYLSPVARFVFIKLHRRQLNFQARLALGGAFITHCRATNSSRCLTQLGSAVCACTYAGTKLQQHLTQIQLQFKPCKLQRKRYRENYFLGSVPTDSLATLITFFPLLPL